MHSLRPCSPVRGLFGLLFFAAGAIGQTATSPTDRINNALNRVPGSNPLSGVRVVVTVPALIDSTTNPAGQFTGTVKNAVNIGTAAVPAGASAVMKLTQMQGNQRMFSLSLVSVTANGQVMPVTSGAAVIVSGQGGAASAATSQVSAVRDMFRGFGGKKQQQQQPAQANQQKTAANGTPSPAAMGARVYVPANSDVQFMVSANNGAPGTQQAGNNAVPAGQPAAPAPQPGAPMAVAPTTPAPAPVAPGQPMQPMAPGAAPAGSTVVLYNNIQYQLQSCKREAPHIICQITITNMGNVDARLVGGHESYYFDQAGNKQMATARSIANCVGFWGVRAGTGDCDRGTLRIYGPGRPCDFAGEAADLGIG